MKKLIVVFAILATMVSGAAFAGAGTSPARSTQGTAYVGVTHAEGDDLYVAGDIKDKILGRGSIVYLTTARPTATGSILIKARKVTLYTAKGSLTGTGQATQTFNPDGTSTVSNGTFNLTRGTAKLRGHSLKGTFSGPFKDGVYTFKYRGTYR